MCAASVIHQVRPASVLLGGSGIRRIVEQQKPDVAALLKPYPDLGVSRSGPADAVVPPWEADFHELGHARASAIAIAMARTVVDSSWQRCEC